MKTEKEHVFIFMLGAAGGESWSFKKSRGREENKG